MRLLVTGGRTFADRELLWSTLDQLHAEYRFTQLLHGDAPGADRLADQWALARGVPATPLPADWKRYGRKAGLIRNRQMLDEGLDLVVAFPGGKGTKHMIEIAGKAGLKVVLAETVARQNQPGGG